MRNDLHSARLTLAENVLNKNISTHSLNTNRKLPCNL